MSSIAGMIIKAAAGGMEPDDVIEVAAEHLLALDAYVADFRKPPSARAWVEWVIWMVESRRGPDRMVLRAVSNAVLSAAIRGGSKL